MSWSSDLVFQLLSVLPLLGGMRTSELEPPSNIQITNYNWNLSASWSWDEISNDDNTAVTFTAFYQTCGTTARIVHWCNHTEGYVCNIPPELLDYSQNYTLHVRSETPQGHSLYNSIDFDPNSVETEAAPILYVDTTDGIVTVEISTLYPSSDDVFVSYVIDLQSDGSDVETFHRTTPQFVIAYNKLSPGVTYCVRARLFHFIVQMHSPFSAARCFSLQLEGLPKNLRVEPIDGRYLLKWDWDYAQYPNVTFSVEQCIFTREWRKIPACGNITVSECDLSKEVYFYHRYLLRTTVYDSQRDEYNSSIVQFHPETDAVMGPPASINLTILNQDLHISMSAPQGFKDKYLLNACDWIYHLEYWKNVTHPQVIPMENRNPDFIVKALEASTTHCVKARTKCDNRSGDENRVGLYSDVRCITTDPRSYVTEWITASVFIGIIVISIVVYICLCPLKRYMKYIYCPSSKLPSSIGMDMQDSHRNFNKMPFSLHEEETFDRCVIIQSTQTEDLVQFETNTSEAISKDSGHYSSEVEGSWQMDICTQ